jgi:5-oxoprolinase (ATP-hydrolysing)
MRANILANRRRVPPRGIKGGGDAKPGRNWVQRTDGSIEELTATASAEMQAGDRFVIETPGGGGFGNSKPFAPSDVEGRVSTSLDTNGVAE